jgi:mRNA interferase MazF
MTTPTSEPAASIRRGAIYWLGPDAARGSVPGSAHPHVVISDDVFNQSRVHTVIVCALTSNSKRGSEPGNVRLDLGEGGLPKQSVAVVSQISSVAKAELGEYIGALSQERVEQILTGLRFQQASFFAGR